MTDAGVDDVTPHPTLLPLAGLIGNWRTSGVLTSPEGLTPIRGTDTYEWLLGGVGILHRIDVTMGDQHVQAIELIADFDAERKRFRCWSFDANGQAQMMYATAESSDVWTFSDETIRARLERRNDPLGMTARWERHSGDGWVHWIDMTFTPDPA